MTKKQFILHVGYPKTATTTIQKHIFQNISDVNYLGVLYDKGNSFSNFSELFEYLVYAEEDLILKKNASKSIYEWLDGRPAFLSDEKIIGSLFTPRVDSYGMRRRTTLSSIIRSIECLFDKELFDIKIILTIRNQADMLPSKYAQSYMRTYSNIKKLNTFDKFIDDLLRNEDSFLKIGFDYLSTYKAFSSAFGQANVLVLPYEMFVNEKDVFVSKLSYCLGVSLDDGVAAVSTKHENKRSAKEGGHRHSKETIYSRLALLKSKYFEGVQLPDCLKLKFLSKIELPFQKNPGVIALSEIQREAVVSLFDESNRELASMTGLDLGGYGYFKQE